MCIFKLKRAFENLWVTCTRRFYLYMVVIMTLWTYESGDKWKEEQAMHVSAKRNGGNLISKGNQMTRHSNLWPPHKRVLDAKSVIVGVKLFPKTLTHPPTPPPTKFLLLYHSLLLRSYVICTVHIESGFEENVPYFIIYFAPTTWTSSPNLELFPACIEPLLVCVDLTYSIRPITQLFPTKPFLTRSTHMHKLIK